MCRLGGGVGEERRCTHKMMKKIQRERERRMGKIMVELFRKKKDEKRHWRRQNKKKEGAGTVSVNTKEVAEEGNGEGSVIGLSG